MLNDSSFRLNNFNRLNTNKKKRWDSMNQKNILCCIFLIAGMGLINYQSVYAANSITNDKGQVPTTDTLSSKPANSKSQPGKTAAPNDENTSSKPPPAIDTVQVTPQGDEIILRPSEAWKNQNPSIYRMPSSATKALKGTIVPYIIWYDDEKWKEADKLNAYAEKSLKLIDGGAVAIVVVDNKEFPLAVLDDIVIKNAKENGFENATIVSDEKRRVNGTDVLFIHWKAKIKGSDVEFLSYLHSGPDGTVMVHTYAPVQAFEKNKKDMENFLNGLVFTSAPQDQS
jgi:hypothetical protein